MKKIYLITLFLGVVFISGCSQDDPNPNPNPFGVSVDQSVFFTITINGRTLTSYGLTSPNSVINNEYKYYCGASITSQGTAESTLTFSILGKVMKLALEGYSVSQNLPQVDFWDIYGYFKKAGQPVNGTYSTLNNITLNLPLTDLAMSSGTVYHLSDSSPSIVTVTSIDQNFISGIINLILKDGNNQISAQGSFRLHKL